MIYWNRTCRHLQNGRGGVGGAVVHIHPTDPPVGRTRLVLVAGGADHDHPAVRRERHPEPLQQVVAGFLVRSEGEQPGPLVRGGDLAYLSGVGLVGGYRGVLGVVLHVLLEVVQGYRTVGGGQLVVGVVFDHGHGVAADQDQPVVLGVVDHQPAIRRSVLGRF